MAGISLRQIRKYWHKHDAYAKFIHRKLRRFEFETGERMMLEYLLYRMLYC